MFGSRIFVAFPFHRPFLCRRVVFASQTRERWNSSWGFQMYPQNPPYTTQPLDVCGKRIFTFENSLRFPFLVMRCQSERNWNLRFKHSFDLFPPFFSVPWTPPSSHWDRFKSVFAPSSVRLVQLLGLPKAQSDSPNQPLLNLALVLSLLRHNDDDLEPI